MRKMFHHKKLGLLDNFWNSGILGFSEGTVPAADGMFRKH